MQNHRHLNVAALTAALVGCSWSRTWETCEDPAPSAVSTPLTWHKDIRPIIEARCVRCHQDGGDANLPLDSLEAMTTHADAAITAIEAGEMPPWLSSNCCANYRFSWDITPTEQAMVRGWIDQGLPEGQAADYVPPPPPQGALSRVDAAIPMPAPYTPELATGETDLVRCFLLDWPYPEDVFVTGLAVRPGNAEIVHHAVVFVAGPSLLDGFERRDREDPGQGWDCSGNLARGYTGWLGGWSPGWEGVAYPDGLGQPVETGSKLVLSVHYAVHHGAAAPDQSTVQVMTAREATGTLDIAAIYDPAWFIGMRIPAGEADVVVSHQLNPRLPAGTRLMSANLHMHDYGRWGQVGIVHADGSVECLLRIDAWDPAWQNAYWLAEPREWRAGDRLFVECHYDTRQLPADGPALHWDHDEEMCLGNVIYAVDAAP